MMKKYKDHLKNERGLTLVELLAVLVIIGIIATIAIVMIGNVISDSRDKAILADAQNILSAAKIAQANGEGTKQSDGSVEFDRDLLQHYVDGVELGPDDKVVYTRSGSKGQWTIHYGKLSDIRNKEKFDVQGTSITDDKLSELLSGED